MQKRHQSYKYRLLGLVGQGQFGQVYCAIHRRTGRLVALKNLNRDRFATHQFLRELRFLLSLDHPNIANCLALDQTGNARQLVLDYCEGGTLRDLLEQGTQLSLSEILTLTTEVLSALEHAHQKRIVHCDIKPENILLALTATGWQAKVSDFGIARLSQEYQQNRSGGTGSPAYMAPERFYFQSSAASDLYAVGVVLYELLVGDRPFSGSYQQLMVCHLNQTIELPSHIPPLVQQVLKKAIEKLIPRRFRSAAEMKAAITAARKTLNAAELRDRFPKPIACLPTVSFDQPAQQSLKAQGSLWALAYHSASAQLLAVNEQAIYSWKDLNNSSLTTSPQQQPQFDSPITQLIPTVAGVIAVAHHQLYVWQEGGFNLLLELPEPVKIVPGSSQRWLVGQSRLHPSHLWLVDLLQQPSSDPRLLPSCDIDPDTRVLVLGDRYYLLITVNQPHASLRLMTRKGRQVGALHIPVPIHQVISWQTGDGFLAQSGKHGQDLLIVRLRPYRIMRCRLDITADWVGELATGFVLISHSGQMRLLNYQGQLIGRVDDLPSPQAVLFHPPHHIWLLSQSAEQAEIYRIDIRQLNLDIIF
ncbi:MAG: serine/threonine-protein kinase [Leptolyngbyaceae cyanobacterium]